MVDFNDNGKSVLPKPDAIQQSAIKQAALSQAASGFGTQAGGVGSALGQAGGTPSAGCSPGTPGGAAAPAEENPTQGPTTNAPGSLSGPLNGVSPSVQNMVRNSVPAGCRAQVTPNGGVGTRSVGGSAHPRGLATDTNLFCGGAQQFKGSPQMNQYLYNLNKNGARGLSYYDSGFVHADLMGQGQRRWGNNQSYLNSATKGENPGPGAAQAAQGGDAGGGGGDPCAGGGSGGCQPVQSSAPQIASGLSKNLGMDVPSMVSGLASALTSGSPIAALMSQATGAVSGLLNQVGLGGIPLSPAALADPTGAISKVISDKVSSMGASIMPSIVGNIPTQLASTSGIVQGLVKDKITTTANQIFSKSSPPKLDRFISVFNAANGAQGFSSSLQETIGNTLNNVFGNASDLFQKPSLNNWANVPGVSVADNPYLKLDGPDIGEVRDAIDNTINRSQFIGEPEIVLNNLINKSNFNAFSSMFYDWDAYTTRGYGTITNNVIEFGTDLKGLGKLADLNDILRIGTPGQIAQQIILNGAGTTIGLSSFMMDNKLSFVDLSTPENDPLVYEFLTSVSDANLIGFVKEVLGIDETINLQTLGDLLESQIILPRSYDYNYFENLNDIAVFLSICNGGGQVTTLAELGALIESFEVPFDSSNLTGDPAIYNYKELSDFASEYAPVGFFTSDGSLSIADFIGTAAGYIHETTIPRIAELQSLLYEETTYFDDYMVLVQLLLDAANGVYQVIGIPPALNTVVVPNSVGYTFGTYNTLDDAISDITDAIELELLLIQDTLLTETNTDILEWVRELDSLHTESSMQLAREHKLRKEYGFKLGPPKASETFIGDGITGVLPLSNDIDVDDDITVFVNGIFQGPSNYTINAVTNKITLSSAPSVGVKITVNYRTGAFDGLANKMQVWDFASNLENYALETGYGRSADFLRRIVTNDEYGQRISATLMNARNKSRSEAVGLNCPNFETVNGSAPSYINYVDWTGIWTSNPGRASEVWLQNNQDVDSLQTYLVRNIQKNKDAIQPEMEIITNNIVRQLVFYYNGNIVMSDLMADLYQKNQNKEIYADFKDDLVISYSDEIPNEGYILGPYKEIISDIVKKEGFQNTVFTQAISDNTIAYLKEIRIDISMLITIAQRILMVNVSKHLGIDEGDAQNIFGMQSLSKCLMYNIANNY
jgi:hypothetical protein